MTDDRTAAVDRLIPAPWTGPRRAVAAAVAVAVAGGLLAAWWFGLLGPNLAPVSAYGFGPADDPAVVERAVAALPEGSQDAIRARGIDGVIELDLRVENRGILPVRDLRVRAPVEQLVQQAPVDVPARGERQVRLYLLVTCDDPQWPPFVGLHYHAVSGPFASDGRALRLLGEESPSASWAATEPDLDTWWDWLAQPVCDPEAFAEP